MTTQYGRVAAVEVGPPGATGRRVEGPLIRFEATKVIGASDTCAVTVWNPADATVDALATAGNVTRVLAGNGTAQQLAYGTVIRGTLLRDRTAPSPSVSWRITDGSADFARVIVSRAWATAVSADIVIRALAGDLGLALGNVSPPAAFRYPGGFVALGNARDTLDEIAADTRCVWSVLDGVLHFWPRGQARQTTGYLFAPETGMVGSPVPMDNRQVQVKGLLLPAMRPGDRFRVQSRDIRGDYVAVSVVHRGEAAATGPVSDEFHTIATGRPL